MTLAEALRAEANRADIDDPTRAVDDPGVQFILVAAHPYGCASCHVTLDEKATYDITPSDFTRKFAATLASAVLYRVKAQLLAALEPRAPFTPRLK